MDNESNSRPQKGGVYRKRTKARIAEAVVLARRCLLPGQREMGLHIRYVGISSSRYVEGEPWANAQVKPDWGLGGAVLSIIPPPKPTTRTEDGWEQIKCMWRFTPELLEAGGDPKYLVMNPLAKTGLRFDSFPSRSYSKDRDVVIIDLVEAHKRCRQKHFLPVFVREQEVARFHIRVKTESEETGTVRIYYTSKTRVNQTP